MRLIYAFVINLLLFLTLPLRALRRARACPQGGYIEIELDGAVAEIARRRPFWQRAREPLALESLRRALRLAARDRRVAGVLLRLKSFTGGSARATSLRSMLTEFRATQKRVVVYLPNGGGTLAAYIASAADRVFLGPETELALTGFAVEANHLRGALDRLGVEAEVMAKGRYKTAGEFLTQRSMSEPQREQLSALLDVAWDVLVEALSSGRKVDRARAAGFVEGGPWSAKEAVNQGIADAVLYEDELEKALDPEREGGARSVSHRRYVRRRQLRWVRPLRGPYLAVVDVVGPIVTRAPFLLVPVAAEEPVVKTLRAVADDPRALGLLLNVSSRGGSAVASDRMLHAIRLVAEKKPVVAYLGDVAASGGYMVAVGAHCIVAQPTTVTGSIGVVAARLVGQGLLGKLGIDVEVVKRGAHADMLSPARRLEPDERALLERQIDEVYASFVDAVARGRKRPPAEIAGLAGGRVWSGRDAHRHGLIDQLGGFDLALQELRTRIGAAGARLEPLLVGPRHLAASPKLLGFLRSASDALGLGPLSELSALALSEPGARAWLLSEAAALGD
jgi:protease IV